MTNPNLQNLLVNPAALAAVYASAANVLNDLAAASGNANLQMTPHGLGSGETEKPEPSPTVANAASVQQQECANCGAVSTATQLKRYGNLSHYLCTKCGNASTQRKTSDSHPGRKVSPVGF